MIFSPNGTPNGMSLEDFVREEGFTALLISWVKNEDPTAEQTFFERCAPEEADVFSLYGICPDGESLLIHDFDVGQPGTGHMLVDAMGRTGLSITYEDTTRISPLLASPMALAEWLTETIHDEIPGYDDPEEMDTEAFDNHPLAFLREEMVKATPYGAANQSFTVRVAANVRAYLDIEVTAATMHEAVLQMRLMDRQTLLSEFDGSITPVHADPWNVANAAVIMDISDDDDVAFDLEIEIPDEEAV